MKRWITCYLSSSFLFVIGISGYAQDLFTISLKKFTIDPAGITLRVSEIIDARKDKNVVGIIQLGLKNRKDLAVFEKPGLQEVEELLDRSRLISKEKGLVIRVSKLAISEITGAWKEIARAEVSLDFFIRHEDNYYYISSAYATVDPNGMDVTREHAANIVKVIERAFIQFSSRGNKVNADESFLLEDLTDPNQNFRNVASMLVVKETKYKEGYYKTFDEFINNAPSIDVECKIKTGAATQCKCGDKEESVTIYGYSKDNQLFVLFHHNFYLLEREKNGFFFRGPREFSSKDITDTYNGIIARTRTERAGYNAIYTIDLGTGSINNTTGF